MELGCKILVLIPKGNTDTRGIGLLELLWKVAEEITDTLLRASVRLHDFLYIFRTGRGTGTTILQLKLYQELSSIDQYPPFLVFINLHKNYGILNRGNLPTTLEGYGAGPCMCRILAVFWDHQEVFTRQSEYHGPHFKETWGTTQGGIILPTLFNFIIENVVTNWLAMTVEDQLVAHEGLGLAAGRYMGLFYTDYGVVG